MWSLASVYSLAGLQTAMHNAIAVKLFFMGFFLSPKDFNITVTLFAVMCNSNVKVTACYFTPLWHFCNRKYFFNYAFDESL